LNDTRCRYTVYDHEYKTKDGRMTSKVLFISWTPLNSNQNDKILYSQQRHSFKESLHGTTHHNVATKKEIEKALLQAEGKGEESDNDDD
jgi:cofilin